ncbi:MAG: hypothetical protein V2A34_10260 [Lentisphaerota bacterium]
MKITLFVCMVLISVRGFSEEVVVPESAASLEQLKTAADEYARSGDTAMQAGTYEQIAARDPASRVALAPLLVRLYAGLGKPDKALSWAQEVMLRNPDPQAYLAGVHTILGQFEEARAILVSEIAGCKDPKRKTALCWQMADVCEKSGDLAGEEKFLNEAVKTSAGLPESAATEQRLKAFLNRRQHE